MKGLLKGPLIVAAVVVVGRVVTERLGAPQRVNDWISAAALTCLIGPAYFAMKIARSGATRPYSTQLKATALYAVLVRAMLLPVYWLAFYLSWPEPRFFAPPDAGPFMGYIALPFGTAAFWIVASVIAGGILGALIIALGRRLGYARA
jgi:hypothetical protein